MRKHNRILSWLFVAVLVIQTLFSDFVLPSPSNPFVKTADAAEYLRTTFGITSDYIKNHLNESAAASVEDTALVPQQRTALLAAGGVSLDASAGNDTLLMSDYDNNGLAPTYHYIQLNYSLAESAVCVPGTTISDIWKNHPESFIASIYSYANVYALEGEDDYLVAFVNPGAVNTMGSAIYADFTNGDNENPVNYADTISFDASSGIIYIPKSFYFVDGEEVIKNITAQVLVPYTFTQNNTSLYQLTVENEQPGVAVVEAVSARTAQAFDVKLSFPIATFLLTTLHGDGIITPSDPVPAG